MAMSRARLVATSHGTDSVSGQRAIAGLVDAVRDRAPHLTIEQAFVDVQTPSVADVVSASDRPCVVVPLLLASGFHVHVDIRAAVDRDGAVAASALGTDERLAAILRQRLVEAGAVADDAIVLAGAGSSDVRALDSVEETAQLLAGRWGSPVTVGYLGGTGTRLEPVVAAARATGRRVVVASYLLAPGYFAGLARRSGADVVTAPLLGDSAPDPRLVDIVLDRFHTAETLLAAET